MTFVSARDIIQVNQSGFDSAQIANINHFLNRLESSQGGQIILARIKELHGTISVVHTNYVGYGAETTSDGRRITLGDNAFEFNPIGDLGTITIRGNQVSSFENAFLHELSHAAVPNPRYNIYKYQMNQIVNERLR